MRGKPWSSAEDALVLSEAQRVQPKSVGDWVPIGVKVGRTGHACRLRHALLKSGYHAPDTNDTKPATEPDNLVSPLGPKALSEQEMLTLFQVDTLRWEPNRLSHNIWEMGAKGPDGALLAQPMCQTTLTLKRIEGAESLVALTDSLLASLTAAAPKAPPFVITRTKAQHLLEVDAFDLHLGKTAWGEETGHGDYDLSIATRDFREAFDDCLQKTSGFQVAEGLFPVGNDLLQTDNLRSETTAGTRVDSDSRYFKMFEAAITEMRWAIDRLLTRTPKVTVKGVRGNHDYMGSWTVVRVLEAIYANDKRVTFDNAPTQRKYHRWGQTLLGFTHGNEEKQSDLPLIMAHEKKEDWAATLFHEWHVGHHHKHKKTKYVAGESFGGVTVRTLRSLSAVDAWHSQKGYVGGRRAIEAFVYHLEEGEVGAFISRHPQPNE